MTDQAKVSARHRQRRAVVYVRQSTPGQVERNTESSARQDALAERAIELGWPAESVVIVDEDTGRSAAWARSRIGFRELVAEVGLVGEDDRRRQRPGRRGGRRRGVVDREPPGRDRLARRPGD